MNALDQLRATHARATTADELERTGRALTDVLFGDDLDGPALYDAIEAAAKAFLEALDAHEEADREARRLPAPEPPTEANTKLCALTEQPADTCGCAGHRAQRGEVEPEPDAPDGEQQCRSCNTVKPFADYSRNGKGLLKTCKDCMSAKQRAAHRKRKAKAKVEREPKTQKEPA